MNRLERLSTILIQLQSGGWVRSQDIADRFEITARTVYRDIQSLTATGVPILSEPGKGYRMVDGYRLPPVQFSYKEAAALITADKLIELHTDKSLYQDYKSALFKIKSILRQTDKEYLQALEDNIQVLPNPYLPVKKDQQHQAGYIQSIIEAIAHKKIILLSYKTRDQDQSLHRKVEPIGIFQLMNKWHIIAYCQLRRDYRDFRIDRIDALTSTTDCFTKSHPTLKKYLSKIVRKENLTQVILRMKKEDARYLGDQKYYNGYVSEKTKRDELEITFLTGSLRGFAHWYMMIGLYADILEPAILKDEVSKMVQGFSARLGNTLC